MKLNQIQLVSDMSFMFAFSLEISSSKGSFSGILKVSEMGKLKIQKLYWSKLKTAHPNSPLLPAVLAARGEGVLAIWSLNTYKYCYIGKMGKSKPTKEL